MNIQYEQIIEKANARKLALEALSTALEEASDKYADLSGVLTWLVNLQAIYCRLDDEGRNMLPDEVHQALANVGSTLQRLKEARHTGFGHGVFFLLPKDSE